MADEIKDQNVIKVFRVPRDGPDLWAARIGPRGRALWGFGESPPLALSRLAARIDGEWLFDPSWIPRDAE